MIDRSIYIHIPFCESKCYYCDFYSEKYQQIQAEFLRDKIFKEISFFFEQYPNSLIKTIYIGGGTPSIYPIPLLEQIINHIVKTFSCDIEEFTIEVNPGLRSCENYKQLGINRVSVGVQCLSNEVLRAIGRKHTASEALVALEKLSSFFENVSCDLILGLPKQNEAMLINDIQIISQYVKHFSIYMLAIQEGTVLYNLVENNILCEMDDDKMAELYYLAKAKLNSLGYSRYEVSNFTKSGFQSIHNSRYWEGKEYFGVGPSACSLIENKRMKVKTENYFSSKEVTVEIEESLTDRDLAYENVILSLRTDKGLNLKDFTLRFGKTVFEIYPKIIPYIGKVFRQTSDSLHILEDFFLKQNLVFQKFFM